MDTRPSPSPPPARPRRSLLPLAASRATARTAAALLAASALLVSGCGASGTGSDGTVGAALAALPMSTPLALSPYYTQKLSWRECGGPGFECATMKVPLDYDRPASGDIKLAVARKKATGKGKPLGSLLVNPGGPGGSAIAYLQQYAGIGYPAEIRARYDMVAVDPRGVARSEPVECLDGRQMDAFTEVDMTPDDAKETDALAGADRKFAEACGEHSAKLLRHVSTVEAARDMDVLRELLGDKKLNYVGASYGTLLGATYAGLFPHRTGRLVLDGAMDPSLDARQVNLDQTAGFETAFRAFSADCVKRADCPLDGKDATPAQVGDRMQKFFRALDAHPIPTGDADGRRLTESLATIGVVAAMYDQSTWEQLREALNSAMDKNDGAGLLALSDSYYERDSRGHYSNLMMANAAVNCLDLPPAFESPEQVEQALPQFEKASPVFGPNLAWSALNCTYWPVRATGEPHRIEAKGAAPIVVVGTTRDPATPYRWAQSLSRQLSSAHLLTYEGDGHTAYGRGSACIDSAINTYLLRGTPPAPGKRCT
ncbi:alpha/beta hydrolase [Streptomyces griseoluteus]|uniref:alpha/beta hydrolase n=1 Tax=Streptomyces griseoluteus TaxID=29306 RepID=UPI00342D1698